MFEAKKLVMVSLWQLPKELSDFFRNMHDGVCNDVSKVSDYVIPYDDLEDFEGYVLRQIIELECYRTPADYLANNPDDVFLHELFKLDQKAFIGYEGIVVDMSW